MNFAFGRKFRVRQGCLRGRVQPIQQPQFDHIGRSETFLTSFETHGAIRPVMDIGVSEYWAQLGGLMAKSLLVLALVLLPVLLETALS